MLSLKPFIIIILHCMSMFSSSCLDNCVALKTAPPQGTTLKLNTNFVDTAFTHMLKDYSVFSFVLRVKFQSETKG